MAEDYKGMFSFGSMTLLVGGLALFALLAWGWLSGQSLPLWPALLVAGVNVVGAIKLLQETKAKQAAARNKTQRKHKA
ncbi:MAG: hypothetical protein U1E85_09960 [Rhodocyclaceae bacterium]|nr:hypothetical protein [Accumulibacter sp.]HNJ76894.1 hypothetical protein [Azospira sp.]HNN08992.1 hypothetical protein [Azospira sp.]HNN46465.1 hypothetical protein [Azospira sp.]